MRHCRKGPYCNFLFRWSLAVLDVPEIPSTDVKPSKMRWMVLAVFFLNAGLNGIQYTNYVMIPGRVKNIF